MSSALKNSVPTINRRKTHSVKVRDISLGGDYPIAVQSMCATKTQDIDATLSQINLLLDHGADIIRIAIDSKKDVDALKEIRTRLDKAKKNARIVVDLQESYRLMPYLAPLVDKVRYNPGHLHHHEKSVPVKDKVAFIVSYAKQHSLALRIGVNFGSLDPAQRVQNEDPREAALSSVSEHITYMRDLEFDNFVVSLKSSNPNDVMDINQEFSQRHPLVPIHLGVTEAGMLPMGEIKTRIAFENLLAQGIGDTLRVSLTLPFAEKYQEILVGKKIIEDVYAGRFRSVPRFKQEGLNIISCPSCSRVENEKFIELAEEVRELAQYAKDKNLTIAIMGCRVNGPGETDDADLGLWCAPKHVNLKLRGELLGAFSYEDILGKVKEELDKLIVSD
jgi:(E)-4-hydroxy-3-methylbut-2-enyl-diphosphate synthase